MFALMAAQSSDARPHRPAQPPTPPPDTVTLVLYAESVSQRFKGVPVLDEVSFNVGDGERVGLIGPNGAGKSTLLRIIAGEQPPDEGRAGHRAGSLGFLRQDAELSSRLPLIEEMWNSFPDARAIEEQLQEVAAAFEHPAADVDALITRQAGLFEEFERLDGYRIDKRIGQVLSGLGFAPDDRFKACGAFSGGWRMRVALAQVLVRRPDHLLLDEPTNHLDAAARAWLIAHIGEYKGTVMIVSHETDFLDATVTRIIDLRDGEATSYAGNHSAYRRQKSAAMALQRSTADRQQREIKRQTQFIDRFRSKATKARTVQSRIKAVAKIERVHAPTAERAVHFQIDAAGRPERAVLTVQDLSHAYDDEHIVLVGANLEIERGDKVALVGPNGSGKSTLLRALAGRIDPTEGSIAWSERARVGYYDQHQDEELDPGRTVLDEVAAVAITHSDGDLRSVLGRFLFRGDDVFKPVSVLSGGERSRVALAKFLIQPSNVLLLDEPTNHLDGATRTRLIKALADYDGTIVCASHDPAILRRVATRAFEIDAGECRPLMHWRDWTPPA